MNKNSLKLIKLALSEDIGTEDVTSEAIFKLAETSHAVIIAKENGIISGLEVAQTVCALVDKSLDFISLVKNGDFVSNKQKIVEINGKTVSILKAERVMLNFLQRLSGVATRTNHFVKLIDGFKTKILDTRKTTPGMREIEKLAVLHGGGTNHRTGLFDQALIKENHIAAVGSITEAVKRVRKHNENKKDFIIVVEVQNLDEVTEAIELPISRILIDNFTPELAKETVQFVNGKMPIEASGGITEKNIIDFAKAGVNFISIGAVTHSIKSLDLSLLITNT
ncbi:carboxylating nicotinate-nucleotide diphosphorylase [bacterium]|nr:carboxylating nicotinate-nucleotide diphosphorylase [bacterium]